VTKDYILDTSAILSFIRNEQGSDTVEKILNDGRMRKIKIYISFITFMEIYYTVWKYAGEAKALEVMVLMNALPFEHVHSTDRLSLSAGRIKANNKLSVADAFIAATAIEKKAILVHKDPELAMMQKYVESLILPFKKDKN